MKMVVSKKGNIVVLLTSQSILENPLFGLGPTKREHELLTFLNDLHVKVSRWLKILTTRLS